MSGLEASTRLDATRSAAVVAGFLGVLTLSVLDLVPLFKGLLVMLVVLLFSRILTLDEIRRRFPWISGWWWAGRWPSPISWRRAAWPSSSPTG